MLNTKINAQQRFHPRTLVTPKKCDNPRTGTTSSSLGTGAVTGDRLIPSSSYQCFVFHFTTKEILQNLKEILFVSLAGLNNYSSILSSRHRNKKSKNPFNIFIWLTS
jgi:hypothetical protein